MRITTLGAVALAMTVLATSASAQVLGTFSWQMQPYCNTVTLTLTTVPAGFALDGSDDQCGAATKGSATGIGVFNPNGTVGVNFTIVTSPGGKGVQVSAQVSPANGQGTWTDSVGNSGTFAFFGALSGLPLRPLPASGVAPATITATEIAAAAIGAAQINAAQVQARVSGACPPGQAMSGVNSNGTVACTSTQLTTVRGSYVINFDAQAGGDRQAESFSFGRTLPSAPTAHWLAEGAAPTADCPGTPAMPSAAPGHLCVYTAAVQNLNLGASCVTNAGTGYLCNLADPYGATLYVQSSAAGATFVRGSWAVTSP